MQEKHTRRGSTQATDYLSLEGEGGTKYRVREKVNKANLIGTPSSVLGTSSPSRGKETTHGFTLIELLVVVLIIGILAAIAVPQYQKAVKKARLAEFISTVSSITKAVDVWLLENGGHPDDWIYFTNTKSSALHSSLAIELPFTYEDQNHSYNHLGGWDIYCMSTSCGINLYTNLNENGQNKNVWLDGAFLSLRKRPSDENIWKMESATKNTKLICQTWKESFGLSHMRDSLKTTCAELGVE